MTVGHNIRAKKHLGQHFLKDQGIIHHIIDRAGFSDTDLVLEIGPGLGALTLPLAGYVRQIIAVEKDPDLIEALVDKISKAGISNVIIINEDILRFDMSRIPFVPGEKIRVIGNLPYNISSPFLEMLVGNRDRISHAVLMLQFEFARRLMASPGGKEYGAMTVLTQYHAAVSPVVEVSKDSFFPKPKIGSMVLAIDLDNPHPRKTEDDVVFRRIVRGSFAQRRKTILNSLSGAISTLDKEEISALLESCGIDPGRRAETLDIDDFLNITSAMVDAYPEMI
jgi:16S rRNA (adenine1518-N6/adenine1519-N6)-dimethyltransferase